MQELRSARFLSVGAWLFALALVFCALFIAWRTNARAEEPLEAGASLPVTQAIVAPGLPERPASAAEAALPAFRLIPTPEALYRLTIADTIIPQRPELDVDAYTVDLGDSVFEIANKFEITPETVLWANYDQLNDNPDLLSLGMVLNIPPVDGVYYQWKEGDSVAGVAAKFEVAAADILNWPGNHIDLVEQVVQAGAWIMVPGGHREFRQWLIPDIPRGRAGVSPSVYGAGACEGGYDGAYGSGSFVWPAGNHVLSGNDYWDGHLGVDIAAGEGAQVYGADAGVVVFAGWANGGYGNMVMIDHGNGYQTVYAHMSSVSARCGQSVSQGGLIGYAGNTGNSTGPHLHFEVRFQGGFVNPWYVLP